MEAASCAATNELPSILCNSKVHYRVHKTLPLFPTPRQISRVDTTSSYAFKIHFNNIHIRLGLTSGLFPSRFPTNILYAFL
jgi:hypothetical protein